MTTKEAQTQRETPETLGDLAFALSVIGYRIEHLLEGIDELPFTQRSEELLKRMTRLPYHEGAAAFHGLTYAYLLQRNPHLAGLLKVTEDRYRLHVELDTREHKVSMLLPRIFQSVDQLWAKRPVEGE
jgi:hypothetical protein